MKDNDGMRVAELVGKLERIAQLAGQVTPDIRTTRDAAMFLSGYISGLRASESLDERSATDNP